MNKGDDLMKNILAAVDFSAATDEVVRQAADLAKGLSGKLWIIHVASDEAKNLAYESTMFFDVAPEYVTPPGDIELARDLCADEYRREHSMLLNISAKMREDGVDAQALMLKDKPAERILEKAEDLDIDIIVMGSHGHGRLRRILVGSTSEAVLQDALCSVLIVPPPPYRPAGCLSLGVKCALPFCWRRANYSLK
jgi:nucleotide-binding universal stress UspA family protein